MVPVASLSARLCMIRVTCMPLTLERLPTCFYHFIKTIREYPDAPKLKSVTWEMRNTPLEPGNFELKDTPPALAYLFLDAMRSAYGKFSGETTLQQWGRIWFWFSMPLSYRGDESSPTHDCDKATDEDIIKRWEWLAACRFKKNGLWR